MSTEQKKGRGRPKKDKKVFDPMTDAKALADAIDEAVIAKEKVDLYRGSLADIKTMAKDEIGIDTKTFNQLLTLRVKRSRDEFEEVNAQLLEMYDHAFSEEQNGDDQVSDGNCP